MSNQLTDAELLATLPVKRTWLDDIVDILLHRPNGTANIGAITLEMMRRDRDVGATPEATITRVINNYCGEANDVDRVVKHDLFARIAPGTYRLCTYPAKPDLIESQNIAFTDPAYDSVWRKFREIAKKNRAWERLKKHRRLLAFAKNVQPGGRLHDTLQARLRFFGDVANDFDVWTIVGTAASP